MATAQLSEEGRVVVVGGGPAGATAADDLARQGRSVLLLDRVGRIKPCGGAIPPRLIKDFAIPDEYIVAKVNTARMISPTGRSVDIHIENGFVGMVDRDKLRQVPAQKMAAVRYSGTWSEKNYSRNKSELESWVLKNGLTTTGSEIWARYNAPFTPWFLRRNEVLIPVK